MKEEVTFLRKVFLTILCLGLTTTAATAFTVFVGAIAFVLPVDETLVLLLVYGAYIGSFAFGVYWASSIWRETGAEAGNQDIQKIASTLFAMISPFFCAVVGAGICTYVGYRIPIQLPHIIRKALVANDGGQSTLAEIYPVIGIIAGLCFWLKIIDKKQR